MTLTRLGAIIDLARREDQGARNASPIDREMELGIESSFGAPHGLLRLPSLRIGPILMDLGARGIDLSHAIIDWEFQRLRKQGHFVLTKLHLGPGQGAFFQALEARNTLRQEATSLIKA